MAKNANGEPVPVEAGGRTVDITSPEKVMFPGERADRPSPSSTWPGTTSPWASR